MESAAGFSVRSERSLAENNAGWSFLGVICVWKGFRLSRAEQRSGEERERSGGELLTDVTKDFVLKEN